MKKADAILLALFTTGLAKRGGGQAYTIELYDKRATTDLESDPMHLHDKDAAPLIKGGLLTRFTNGTNYFELTPAGAQRAAHIVKYKPLNVGKLLEWARERALFNPAEALGGETAIPLLYAAGRCKLILVLGENAGGKSMFRRVMRSGTHPGQPGGMGDPAVPRGPFPVPEFVGLSMQGRTNGGMMSSFIYGNEGYRSTGENSAYTVTMGIKTARERTHPTVLYWDEPDIGMSAGAAAGAGEAIRQFVEADDAPLVQAIFLTSHSPALVRQLIPLRPHYVHVGDADGPKTLDAWFERQANPAPISPEALRDLSHKRHDMIQKILHPKKG